MEGQYQGEPRVGEPNSYPGFKLKIFQDVAKMLEVHDKLVSDNEQVIKLGLEDMECFERVLDVAKVYKLQSERHS